MNAVGDVVEADGAPLVASQAPPDVPGFPEDAAVRDAEGTARTNTTLVVVATNARCTKVECHLLARSANHGLARAHPSVAHAPRRRPRVRVRDRHGRRPPRPPPGDGHRRDGRGGARRGRVPSRRHPDESRQQLKWSAVSLLEPPPFASWADLEREALACTKCPLAETRTQVVFGVGDPHADLLFVGEGPGEQEDLTGEPFVGRAGRLLTSLIEGIGLTRAQVYIANVVKCRPPGNRDPLPLEIESCRPYLEAQLEFIEPAGRRDPRQLRHQAAARHQGRHHQAARPGVPVPRRRGAHPGVPPVGGAAQRRCRTGAGARRLRHRSSARSRARRHDDVARDDAATPTRRTRSASGSARCSAPATSSCSTATSAPARPCWPRASRSRLGVTEPVVSPTFTVVREYDAPLPLVHVDVYRLDHLQELHDLGFDDLSVARR